ncbi:collagen-like protein [Flavobacteriaceae bacterium TP-CH-4]|uniref:Collagen-like protein n=1 Tax=Pelagihabitans pacificus TaxID=2696054 RepID=A0A967EFC0_9FLAO|nr:collagen-like protein [Pelagihabitans pacificus]NHF61248.1 collagen-like protein [Pelagihabitans pacificus]
MKKATLVLGAFLTLFFISCEGPQGPPGFDGLDGLDGLDGQDGIQGQVFEIEGINFGYDAGSNLWTALETFADYTNFEIFESDAVLVYRFDGQIDLSDGSTADAWSLVPQNFFVPEGTIQYTVAHTFVDFEIFIDGNFDLSLLDPIFTDDQIFRVVIVPSEFLQNNDIDKSNISSVMGKMGLELNEVQKIHID